MRGNLFKAVPTYLISTLILYRLENTALLLADELNAQQALAVAEALEEIQSRNLSLMNK